MMLKLEQKILDQSKFNLKLIFKYINKFILSSIITKAILIVN